MTIFIEIGFWLGLVLFAFVASNTWIRIPQNNISFRGRFLFLACLFVWTDGSLAYIAPNLFAINVEAAYKVALIFGLIGALFLFLIYRYRHKSQFLRRDDFQTLASVYVAHNLHVAYLISDMISNVSQIEQAVHFPNHHRSLKTLIGILKRVFLKNTPDVDLMISILETRANGTFEVVYTTDNIPLPIETHMQQRLRWEAPVRGMAGLCAALNKAVLYSDVSKEKSPYAKYWVNITGKRSGGILCVPIPYPQNLFDGDEGQIGKCFGVLCISASKPNFLQEYHREWIEAVVITSIVNLLLIHRLHDRMYLE